MIVQPKERDTDRTESRTHEGVHARVPIMLLLELKRMGWLLTGIAGVVLSLID